jgi:hypothetical protein
MTVLQADIRDGRLIQGQFGSIQFGPWGFEASDRVSFLTTSEQSRHVEVLEHPNRFLFAEGKWALEYQTRQESHEPTLRINAQFTALRDGLLQDAVIHLVFDKSAFAYGEIANRRINHRNRDKYRLYPVNHVRLCGAEHSVDISLDHSEGTGRFTPYMYLRDRGDHWIVHARLLPDVKRDIDIVWLRWANRFFTLSAPDRLAKLLWQMPGGKAVLWRTREKLGRLCPEVQAVPLNRLSAGQTLELGVSCRFR